MSARQILKVSIMFLLVGFFVTCFTIHNVCAQDYRIWESTWLKLNASVSGYEADTSFTPPRLVKFSGSSLAFMYISTWDTSSSFSATFYTRSDFGWTSIPITLYIITGNRLDFLFWSKWEDGDITSGDGILITFTGHVKGTLSKDGLSLQKVNLTSLGGFLIEKDTADPSDILIEAAGIKVKGSLIIPATFCKGANIGTPPCL